MCATPPPTSPNPHPHPPSLQSNSSGSFPVTQCTVWRNFCARSLPPRSLNNLVDSRLLSVQAHIKVTRSGGATAAVGPDSSDSAAPSSIDFRKLLLRFAFDKFAGRQWQQQQRRDHPANETN